MIKILSFYIYNFFSFKSKTDVSDLADITSFIGINNAGKSNILRTLRWYKRLLKDNYSSNDTSQKYHKKNKNNLFDFEITFRFNFHYVPETSFEFRDLLLTHFLRFDQKGELIVEKFIIKNPNQTPIMLLYKNMLEKEPFACYQSDGNLHNYIYSKDMDIPLDIPLDYQSLNKIKLNNYDPFRWQGVEGGEIGEISRTLLKELKNYIDNWFFFEDIRFINDHANTNPPTNHFCLADDDTKFNVEEMDSRGNNASLFLESKHSAKPKDTIKSMDTISKVFDLKEIKSTKGDEWPRKINTFTEDKNDIESPIDLMGSGFQQALIISSNILLNKKNKVFLIEEPEIHLHPKAQREFLNIMREGVKDFGHQFLITTHSSIFSLIRRDEFHTFLVTKNRDSTSVRNLNKDDLQEVKEILGYKNSDIFGYDAILFVEGHTEEKTLPLFAEIIGLDIIDKGIGIFNSESYGNMIQIGNLIDMLESTGTKVYALYDDHERQQKKLRKIEDKIPENRRVKLNGSFEDCFSKDVLVDSLKNLIKSKEIEYSTDYQKFDKYAELETILSKGNESNDVFKYICKYYYDITTRDINKVEYGKQIVDTIKDKLNKMDDPRKAIYRETLLKLGPFKILEIIHNDLTGII